MGAVGLLLVLSRARTSGRSATAGSSRPTTPALGARDPAAAQSWRRAEVLPQADWRELPARRAAGGGAAREAAAPRALDGRCGATTPRATTRLFADAGLAGRVALPVEPPDRRHIFNQYVVRVPERDRVRALLAERRHRHRDLLPRAVPPAGVLRVARSRARRFPAGGGGRRFHARAADLRRAERPSSRRRSSARSAARSGRDARARHRRARPARRGDRARVRRRPRRSTPFDRARISTSPTRPAVTAPSHGVRPDLIVNCAAYNNVDGAEQEPDRGAARQCVRRAHARARRGRGRRDVRALQHRLRVRRRDRSARTPRTIARTRGASTRRRSCSATGSRSMRRGPTCCVSRACSASRAPAARAGAASARSSIGSGAGAEVPVFVDRTVSPSYTADIAAATRALVERRVAARALSLRERRRRVVGRDRGGSGAAARAARCA